MKLAINKIQQARPSLYNEDQWFRTVEFTGEDGVEYVTYVDNQMNNYVGHWDTIVDLYDDDPRNTLIVEIPNFKLKKDNVVNADRKVHLNVEDTLKANPCLLED